MNKKAILSAMLLAPALFVDAQSALPEGMVALLPQGVTYKVSSPIQATKKDGGGLCVVGSPEKGYQAFFVAETAATGSELWATDGTPEGTRLVKDIYPGTNGSSITCLARLGDRVIFAANDGENGVEPWISDGTADGTYMIKDIHELESSSPIGFTQLDETRAVFAAMDFDSQSYGEGQQWLWITDGTEEGTQLLCECDCRWPGRSNDVNLREGPWMRVGRKVFFKAKEVDGRLGEELWVTDGTKEGTYMIKDLNDQLTEIGTGDASLTNFMNYYNERLMFSCWSPNHGHEPWTSDGTADGTFMAVEVNPGVKDTGSPVDGWFTLPCPQPLGSKVFFRANSPVYGAGELGVLDVDKAVAGDTDCLEIKDLNPTPSNDYKSSPGQGWVWKNHMFCSGNSGTDKEDDRCFGGEMFVYHGETGEAALFADMVPGTGSFWPKLYTTCGGSMYLFSAGAYPAGQSSLWRVDDPHSGTMTQITQFTEDGDKVHSLRNLNGTLLFVADSQKQMYAYTYRKADYDALLDADQMEPEYRTRKEMEQEGVFSVKNDNAIALKVYNPVNGEIFVEAEGNILAVDIYSAAGQKVAAAATDRVNVANLASGIYIVKVTTDAGSGVARICKK